MVANHVQDAIDGGCRIVEVVEYGEEIGDEPWLEKMPAHLLIVGRKEARRKTRLQLLTVALRRDCSLSKSYR